MHKCAILRNVHECLMTNT